MQRNLKAERDRLKNKIAKLTRELANIENEIQRGNIPVQSEKPERKKTRWSKDDE